MTFDEVPVISAPTRAPRQAVLCITVAPLSTGRDFAPTLTWFTRSGYRLHLMRLAHGQGADDDAVDPTPDVVLRLGLTRPAGEVPLQALSTFITRAADIGGCSALVTYGADHADPACRAVHRAAVDAGRAWGGSVWAPSPVHAAGAVTSPPIRLFPAARRPGRSAAA